MGQVELIGELSWNSEDIKGLIPEFLSLYEKIPVGDNQGGMKAPHMFATFFLLKKLNPSYVIESGVWKGQGTWLIEKTCPNAQVISLDIDFSNREYFSDKVKYIKKDFNEIDWSFIKDKSNAVLFFDDHQNGFNRIKQGKKIGFQHFIFEDNYPVQTGDCYSLKKAFSNVGFDPKKGKGGIKFFLKTLYRPSRFRPVKPNKEDALYLRRELSIYYEFPPVFKPKFTRWGDEWNQENYPTPEPIFNVLPPEFKIFEEEGKYYTWMCYAKLKGQTE